MDEIIIYTDDIQILKEKNIYCLSTKFTFIDVSKMEEKVNCIKECVDNTYKNDNVILPIHKILSKVRENILNRELSCLILYTKEKIPLFEEVKDDELKNIITNHYKERCIIKYKNEADKIDEEKVEKINNEEYGIMYAKRLFFKKK